MQRIRSTMLAINCHGVSDDPAAAPASPTGHSGERQHFGPGGFTYDRDLNGDLTDENSTTLNVTAGGNLDLLAVNHRGDFTSYVDLGDTIPDIWQVITNARNYRVPAYPSD